mgnify:CR=1 FL=1
MSRKESSYALGHIVEELTQGKPYVFVVMPSPGGIFSCISESWCGKRWALLPFALMMCMAQAMIC